jgi:dihydroneopterin triphosphate diphosphatase
MSPTGRIDDDATQVRLGDLNDAGGVLRQSHYKIPESVLVLIHTASLEVLLLERADRPGSWQSVTGSKDTEDEPLTQVAIREVFEETGIRIGSSEVPLTCLQDWHMRHVYEIFSVWRHRYALGVTHNIEHVFALQVPRTVPIQLAPREHLHCEWLAAPAAAKRCFSPSNAQMIERLSTRQTIFSTKHPV